MQQQQQQQGVGGPTLLRTLLLTNGSPAAAVGFQEGKEKRLHALHEALNAMTNWLSSGAVALPREGGSIEGGGGGGQRLGEVEGGRETGGMRQTRRHTDIHS